MGIFRKKKSAPFEIFTNRMEKYRGLDIGDFTYGEPQIFFAEFHPDVKLKIGKYCSIAPGVKILLGGNHRTDWITTYPFNYLFDEAKKFMGHPATRGDVTIGNDVWLGMDSTIMSGVTIGDGAAIAIGSIVTKNVEPYSIVAGSPAEHRKWRFDDADRAKLLSIKWWDWSREKIVEAMPLLLSGDVKTFISKYG